MLFEHLLNHAAKSPAEIAIKDESGQYTYQQLAVMAVGMSGFIAGKTQNERIGFLLPSGVGFVASFYGALMAGKSVVPINFLLGEKEIGHVLKDSGIDTILTIPQLGGRLGASGLQVIDMTQIPKPMGMPVGFKPVAKGPGDLAVLMYTSGTSGMPKGVMLTYENLQSDVDAAIEIAQLQHKHRFMGVVPLFHAFGMTAMMLAPIQLGSTIVYMARFSAVAAVNAIRNERISLMFAVPSMFAALAHLKNAGPEDFTSIYALISGGEPLPGALSEKFRERFGVPIYEGYGLTETSPVVALNSPVGSKPGSAGKLLPGVEARIVDDNGAPLPIGQTGEIWLKGKMVMKGYHNLPKETAEALTSDGFFKTGDLGHVDGDGFIFITGRKKELIIVAGEKAVPREIEDMLLAHPAVAEAAVVGKKDSQRGEVVVAFVVAKEGMEIKADALRDFCRQQGLMQWKIPREIFVEKDLPRSPTGKVLKRVLAETANRPV